MFCQHCGKEIADDAVVCIGCGRAVKPLRDANSPSAMVGGKFSDGVMAALIIASVLIPILGVVLGLIYLSSSSSSPERKKQAKIILIVAVVGAVVSLFYLSILS